MVVLLWVVAFAGALRTDDCAANDLSDRVSPKKPGYMPKKYPKEKLVNIALLAEAFTVPLRHGDEAADCASRYTSVGREFFLSRVVFAHLAKCMKTSAAMRVNRLKVQDALRAIQAGVHMSELEMYDGCKELEDIARTSDEHTRKAWKAVAHHHVGFNVAEPMDSRGRQAALKELRLANQVEAQIYGAARGLKQEAKELLNAGQGTGVWSKTRQALGLGAKLNRKLAEEESEKLEELELLHELPGGADLRVVEPADQNVLSAQI